MKTPRTIADLPFLFSKKYNKIDIHNNIKVFSQSYISAIYEHFYIKPNEYTLFFYLKFYNRNWNSNIEEPDYVQCCWILDLSKKVRLAEFLFAIYAYIVLNFKIQSEFKIIKCKYIGNNEFEIFIDIDNW